MSEVTIRAKATKGRLDQPITDETVKKAVEKGEKARRSGVHATQVRYLPDTDLLQIFFGASNSVTLKAKQYPEFAKLSRAELEHIKLGFGGAALCLDEKDLHVSIAGLIAATPPLVAMAKTVVGTRNGAIISSAKAKAARVNGAKGGRPRNKAAG